LSAFAAGNRLSVAAWKRRVADLESLVEGIQDSIHRESRRRDDQADRLERRT
jgi:hypothetical protein